ncbi:MAG TPA: hypothetical protein VJB57_14285, partial [Dehalococcoidia bacterium]|nr:hypothetical protein [Dehalococcoidia bacterium]
MSDNYWARTLRSRIGRRRAMVATGAGALGAAFLAACGGDDGGGGETKAPAAKKDASGLLYQPVDTTKQAVKGGIYENFAASAPQGFDPYRGDNITFMHTAHAYQRL